MERHPSQTGRNLILLGGAAVALAASTASVQVFAQQFVSAAVGIKSAAMVYSPELQMMVNPSTGKPVYESAGKAGLTLPTVTAGCGDCPKKDDDGTDFVSF